MIGTGNGIPDLILNTALARAGYGEMAIAGSIAGPLFNLLVGFSIPMILRTWEEKQDFNVFEEQSYLIFVAFGIIVFNLFRLIVHGYVGK